MSDITDLIDLLSRKTAEGKLRWELDGEARIVTQQGHSIIEVDTSNWALGYSLAVRNLDGVILEQRTFSLSSPDSAVISEMFKRAKRDALGVDKALDDIRTHLLRL